MKPTLLIRAIAFCVCLAGYTFNPIIFAAEGYIDESDLYDDDEFEESASHIADPLKGFNKAVFKFNDFAYVKVMRPISRGYENMMPDPAEKGLKNFFTNLKYPVRLTGSLLQFKFKRAGQETGKFLLNTTIGLGGFMNPAKDVEGLNPPKEDIGQALGRWGIGHGFYLVLPLLGPTSLLSGGRYIQWYRHHHLGFIRTTYLVGYLGRHNCSDYRFGVDLPRRIKIFGNTSRVR